MPPSQQLTLDASSAIPVGATVAVTLPDLKTHIGETSTEYDTLLTDHLAEAQALVDQFNKKWDEATETWVVSDAPSAIVDRAILEVGADLWARRNAPNGIANTQFVAADGGAASAPVRIARDPMASVYKILGRWVTPW